MKNLVATVFYYTGISWVFFFLSRIVYGKHIRVVNYHGTPASQSMEFERQLRWLRKWYVETDLNELKLFLSGEEWKKPRPGLIISFDDGKRNNFDVAKPLLEKYGFIGWFFIPAGWVNASKEEQFEEQKDDHDLVAEYQNDRLIVNGDELHTLLKKHVVGCHTHTHHRMRSSDEDFTLRKEIVSSKELLERILGQEQTIFCWVGGEEVHYTRAAATLIKDAGYQFAFTTNNYPILPNEDPHRLERTNIETYNSIHLVLFQLSGLMDLFYFRKRRRLKQIFSIG